MGFTKKINIVLWALVGLSLIGFGYLWFAPQNTTAIIKAPNNANTELATGQGSKAVNIDGNFTLTSHKGMRVTRASFNGRYRLIFFGFTYCPDVCPFELQTISDALDILAQKGLNIDLIQPIFITVDPARDDVAVLAQYMPAFHPNFIGLTGNQAQIDKVKHNFGVYAQKMSNDSDYLMSHSSLIYFMAPDGTFIKYFAPKRGSIDLAAALQPYLAKK